VRELIEAGMSGALKEDTVVKCLAVNDSLCQVLEYVEHPETCLPSVASMTKDDVNKEKQVAQQHENSNSSSFPEFDAFGIGDDMEDEDFFATKPSNPKNVKPSSSSMSDNVGGDGIAANDKKKSSALDDLLLTPMDALPTPPKPVTAAAAAASSGASSGAAVKDPMQDEFDNFFDD
jgi:hypothetical protein